MRLNPTPPNAKRCCSFVFAVVLFIASGRDDPAALDAAPTDPRADCRPRARHQCFPTARALPRSPAQRTAPLLRAPLCARQHALPALRPPSADTGAAGRGVRLSSACERRVGRGGATAARRGRRGARDAGHADGGLGAAVEGPRTAGGGGAVRLERRLSVLPAPVGPALWGCVGFKNVTGMGRAASGMLFSLRG